MEIYFQELILFLWSSSPNEGLTEIEPLVLGDILKLQPHNMGPCDSNDVRQI